jgi:hypothetical protein
LRTITANRIETSFRIGGIFSIAKDRADTAKVRPVAASGGNGYSVRQQPTQSFSQ